jgi:hypothetical protein
VNQRARSRRRSMRGRMQGVAWAFIASPLLILLFGHGRYSVGEAAVLPVIGLLMLWWFRRRPGVEEHIASVEYVQPDDYHGPDAKNDPFYLPWCDCGWHGDDHADEASARADAAEHTPNVRPALHAWGE